MVTGRDELWIVVDAVLMVVIPVFSRGRGQQLEMGRTRSVAINSRERTFGIDFPSSIYPEPQQ